MSHCIHFLEIKNNKTIKIYLCEIIELKFSCPFFFFFFKINNISLGEIC